MVMQRKQFVLKERKKERNAVKAEAMSTDRIRRNDRQAIREILDRRHQVSIILS